MRFGETPVSEAAGAILAHSLKRDGIVFKKGRILSQDDVQQLLKAGIAQVVAAQLDADDVHEDAAADRLAEILTGSGLHATRAFTGRSNLVAGIRGVLIFEPDRVEALNRVDEAITLATLPPYSLVEPKQIVATIKIIPFSVRKAALELCLDVPPSETPRLSIAPLRPRKVGLVQTTLPGMKESLLDKTRETIDQRLAALDCDPCLERRCAHDETEIASAIGGLMQQSCGLILISGASAIVDRRDTVPAGILQAGGEIEHFGMPVDPGNLILIAACDDVPVVGLPGCARSPKLNGFDWVLQRLLADLTIDPRDVMGMGVGGLLKEIGIRPLPRAQASTEPVTAKTPKVGALLMAAGQSRRMGPDNKLLAEIGGRAMVRHVAEALTASQVASVHCVTGHQAETVVAALSGLSLTLVHNPDYAGGLASSLKRGIAALPQDLDAVLVCLGDMPLVKPDVMDKLIAAFDPLEGRSICIPTWQGKRGNPVLIGRSLFSEIQSLTGDIGAKAIINDHPDATCEVAMPDNSVLLDADTPDRLQEIRDTHAPGA